jgi:hypothetical protein
VTRMSFWCSFEELFLPPLKTRIDVRSCCDQYVFREMKSSIMGFSCGFRNMDSVVIKWKTEVAHKIKSLLLDFHKFKQ